MITFIVPAKNVSSYIDDFLGVFVNVVSKFDFEVIIVDDNSSDDTYNKIARYAVLYPEIKVFRNPGQGKVQALNYGFTLSSGRIIKCVDSDDVILEDIFPLLESQSSQSAIFHDATLVDSTLKPICHFKLNDTIVSNSLEDVVMRMQSPPRWSWSFSRDIGEFVFPMPIDLPYEDVWFSFAIKRNASVIIHLPKSYYLYRQHNNQTFGGVFNFSESIVRFRAKRNMILLPMIQNSRVGDGVEPTLFLRNYHFYSYIATQNWHLISFLRINAYFALKLRFLIILFYPKLARFLQVVLWKFKK